MAQEAQSHSTMSRGLVIWEVGRRDFGFEATMARALGIHPVVAGILRGRGITSLEDARAFLQPSFDQLHDPFLLPDMPAAVGRIRAAVDKREVVLVHGDYDVDGLTAAALMVRFLSKLGADVQYYIPNRLTDRYGLNADAVRQAARYGASLVIAVDCGVVDNDAVAVAREAGMDVVVIDHHEPGEVLPEACAVVDPKRADSRYPERELAGVGLCFKTASAVCEAAGLPQDSLRKAFLDLVALGTIADVVPLFGENRVFTYYGLRCLASTRKVGLQALMRICSLDGAVRAQDVAFRMAPRMNAAGRMGDATDALELLLTDDEQEALRLALQLENANRERQREQERTYREALRLLETQADVDSDHVLVLAREDWHVGVMGIVASKILERHGRPVVLLTSDGEEARGSARSVEEFDISQALEACSDTLIRYGGHALAAGVTLKTRDIHEFRTRLNGLAAEAMAARALSPRRVMDSELLLDEVDAELLEGLQALEPYGQGNPSPLFLTRGAEVLEMRAVGRDEQHLKLFVSQGDRPVDCIGFGLAHALRWLRRGDRVDLCHTPEINEFNGVRGVQLRLEDIRPAEQGACEATSAR